MRGWRLAVALTAIIRAARVGGDRSTEPIDVTTCVDSLSGNCDIGSKKCNLRAAVDTCIRVAPAVCDILLPVGAHSLLFGSINVTQVANASTTHITVSSDAALGSCNKLNGAGKSWAVINGSANGGARLFNVGADALLTVQNLEVSNFGSAATAYGGAIFNRGTFTATDVAFTDNQARIGAVAYTGPFPEGEPSDIVAEPNRSGDSGGEDEQQLSSDLERLDMRQEAELASPQPKAEAAAAATIRGLRGASRPSALAAVTAALAASASTDGDGVADEVNSVTRRRRQRKSDAWGGKLFVQGDWCSSSKGNTTVADFYATADSAAYLFCSPTCALAGNGSVAISTTCAPTAAPTTAGDVPTASPSVPASDDDNDGDGSGSNAQLPWYGLNLQTWMDVAVIGVLLMLLVCVCAGRCRPCCGPKRKCCCWRRSGKAPHGSNGGSRNPGATSNNPEASGTLDYFALPSSAAAAAANARRPEAPMLDALYKHFGVLDHSGHAHFDAGVWKRSPGNSSNGHSLKSGHGGGARRSFLAHEPQTQIPRVSSFGYHDALGSESGDASPRVLSSSSLLRASEAQVMAAPDPTAATVRARLPARRHSWGSSADRPPPSPPHHRPGHFPVEGATAAAAGVDGNGNNSSSVARTPLYRTQDRSVSAAAPSSSSRHKRARTPRSSSVASSSAPSSLLQAALGSMDAQAADWVVNLDQLELGPMVGVGSSAHVFAARYFGQAVAAKRLPALTWRPDEVESFLRQEAGLLVHLHHPSVIKFYGVGMSGDYVYMVTELCDGSLTNLVESFNAQRDKPTWPATPIRSSPDMSMIDAKRAKSRGESVGAVATPGGVSPSAATSAADHAKALAEHAAAVAMPLELLLSLAVGIARGVEFLHSRGVVHRDIKPDNVLLTARREVKICDFGISRMVHDRSGMTTAVGTPLLMAPELVYSDTARESNTASRSATAVDVYSFGVLLWMMATQQLNPYQDMENPWALLAQVTRGRRPPLECRADAARKQHAKAQRAAAAAGAKGSATRPESADAAAGSYVPPSSPMSPAPSSSSSGSGSSNGNGGNSPRKTGTPRARRSRSAEGQWDPPDGEMLRGTNLLKLPQSFRDLIARCWHQDPSCRPTFSVVADELSELQELFLLGGCLDPRNSSE